MLSTHTPKVSVLMPVYNAEEYLAEAIESILGQDFTDFELIAINDGSTDGSTEILEGYAHKDRRVAVLEQPNGGIVSALNAGLAIARGAYVARMDADDVSAHNRFSKQVEFLESRLDVAALGTQIRLIDPRGEVLWNVSLPCEHEPIETKLLVSQGLAIPHASTMMRRSVVAAVNGYRSDYPHAEDIDLFLRIAEVGKLANLNEVLYDYRMHLASVGATKRNEQIASAFRVAVDAALRRGLEPSTIPKPKAKDEDVGSIIRKWGWWALMDGNLATARYYSWQSIKATPLTLSTWKLAMAALRGR